MKRVVLFLLVFSFLGTAGLFADPSIEVQYNEPGQINLTGVVGLNTFGLSVGVGAELIMGDLIFIPEFPMEWGLAARGLFGFYLFDSYSGIDYGAAPLATLHKGFSLGDGLEFDITLGFGLGLYGYSYTWDYGIGEYNYSEPIKFGFASFDSLSWKMKEDLWLTLEYGYVGWKSIYGIGVRLVK